MQLGEHVPGVVALPAADAGRDPLHLPANAGRALAPELQRAHAGGVGHAAATAAAATTQATVGGPHPTGAAAPRQDQPLRPPGRDLGAARLPLGGLGVMPEVTQGSKWGQIGDLSYGSIRLIHHVTTSLFLITSMCESLLEQLNTTKHSNNPKCLHCSPALLFKPLLFALGS